MRPSTIWYTLKQGIKNIKRNFMFSIASIITMAACIFLFGIFFSIVNNVNTLAHKVEEDVPITVLFNEGTTQEQKFPHRSVPGSYPPEETVHVQSYQ